VLVHVLDPAVLVGAVQLAPAVIAGVAARDLPHRMSSGEHDRAALVDEARAFGERGSGRVSGDIGVVLDLDRHEAGNGEDHADEGAFRSRPFPGVDSAFLVFEDADDFVVLFRQRIGEHFNARRLARDAEPGLSAVVDLAQFGLGEVAIGFLSIGIDSAECSFEVLGEGEFHNDGSAECWCAELLTCKR
jgi:hypothetical protein